MSPLHLVVLHMGNFLLLSPSTLLPELFQSNIQGLYTLEYQTDSLSEEEYPCLVCLRYLLFSHTVITYVNIKSIALAYSAQTYV